MDIFYGEPAEEISKLNDTTINKILGNRLKDRRVLMGLNQAELGKKLHISGQQIHKYEAGIDQLSAPKIYELCSILQTPISYFFEDLEADHLAEEEAENYQAADPEEIRFQKYVRLYQDFSDPKLRKLLFDVMRLFAAHLKLIENMPQKTRVKRTKKQEDEKPL